MIKLIQNIQNIRLVIINQILNIVILFVVYFQIL